MGIFKSCCGCPSREQDSEPYETARCAQSTLSPAAAAADLGSPQLKHAVQREDVKPAVPSDGNEVKVKKDRELTFTVSTPSQPLPVGSTGQLFSILEAQSFNPPLCSTKIGEGTPTKCLSLSAIESELMSNFECSLLCIRIEAEQSAPVKVRNSGFFYTVLPGPNARGW
ncbi:hypothetical protein Y032_0104g3628 [Ancylostoma ceylanicum]|uniref:Uncharacterized protein n=1 Tax=Ancylostoma ceylanicum TaxID=53326 RepID=A0A016TGP6_9BILA|nr:hypothetical protein Y032_0104g3628 [Ancylostoma ceylanicum]